MEKRLDLLNSGTQYLVKEGMLNAQAEAEILLAHTLHCPRIELYLDNLAVEEKRLRHFWDLLTLRTKGVPLQYILGCTDFMGLEFKVHPQVFIPRPETEILVETVLKLTTYSLQLTANILDLGTGCGNIAISLAKHLTKAHIFACDISDHALELARENSHLHKVKIKLVKSNLFSAFKQKDYFCLIVSNPPYISARLIPELPPELDYEPKDSYNGGQDGLYYLRQIFNQAPDYLQDGGLLALEIGDNQMPLVKEILAQSGRFSEASVVKDYNNVERIIIAEKQKLE